MKLFFDHEILSLWTCYEKRASALTQLSLDLKILKFKSDGQFYKWFSVTFQKMGALVWEKEKLINEAGYVGWTKDTAC